MLVLDEPGNHLDVDTVEALAEALLDYQGTVIFTSHDRHFMKRVATCIVEVRDGRVTNYRGDYDAYLYTVNKEIEDGERELATARTKPPPAAAKPAKAAAAPAATERTRAAQGNQDPGADDRPARRTETRAQRPVAAIDRRRRSAAPAQRSRRPDCTARRSRRTLVPLAGRD